MGRFSNRWLNFELGRDDREPVIGYWLPRARQPRPEVLLYWFSSRTSIPTSALASRHRPASCGMRRTMSARCSHSSSSRRIWSRDCSSLPVSSMPFQRPSLPPPVSLPMFFPSAFRLPPTVRLVVRRASAQRPAPRANRAPRIVLMLARTPTR